MALNFWFENICMFWKELWNTTLISHFHLIIHKNYKQKVIVKSLENTFLMNNLPLLFINFCFFVRCFLRYFHQWVDFIFGKYSFLLPQFQFSTEISVQNFQNFYHKVENAEMLEKKEEKQSVPNFNTTLKKSVIFVQSSNNVQTNKFVHLNVKKDSYIVHFVPLYSSLLSPFLVLLFQLL